MDGCVGGKNKGKKEVMKKGKIWMDEWVDEWKEIQKTKRKDDGL